MVIYKYLGRNGAKKTLEAGAVLLRTPNQFNDPFDCYYYVDDKEKDKAVNLIVNFLFFKALYKGLVVEGKQLVLGKTNTNLLKKSLILLDKIIKQKKRYRFDKQIELYYWISKKISGFSVEDIRKRIKNRFSDVFKKIRELSLVSCFSLNNKSILMWSHYADSSKGACIEYEINDNNLKTINYSKTMTNFRLTEALEITLGHDYSGEELDVNNENYLFMIDPLLTKSIEWIYENEVRCIFSKNKKTPGINKVFDKKGNELFLLCMPKPKAIYVGCNATKKFIGTIKKLKKDAPVFKAEIKDGEYSIKFSKLF